MITLSNVTPCHQTHSYLLFSAKLLITRCNLKWLQTPTKLSESRRHINVCNSDMFSVVKMYLDYLKFCIVCINGRMYVCFSECYCVSDECDEPTLVRVSSFICVILRITAKMSRAKEI